MEISDCRTESLAEDKKSAPNDFVESNPLGLGGPGGHLALMGPG